MRMKRCFVILCLLVMLATGATAAHAQVITKNNDGIYFGQADEHTFPVYCLNKTQKWPDEGQGASYAVTTAYLADEPKTLRKLQRILFAGYPTNGMNFYTLGEVREISEEEYNRLLKAPKFIIDYETENGDKPFEYLADITFTLEVKNDHNFLQTVSNLADEDMKSLIYETEFYKAVFCLDNYDNPQQSLANQFAPSEKNAWWATQYAIWELMTRENIEGNDFHYASYYPLAKKLLDFAEKNEPEILYGNPEKIQLSAQPVLTYDEAQRMWISQPLSIRPAANYATTYRLHLPDGFRCLNADANKLHAGESFRIATANKASAVEKMRITAQASWASDVFLFSTNDRAYQHMGGVYRLSQELETAVELRYATIPQTGDDFPIILVGGALLASAMVLFSAGSRRRKV